MEKSIRKFIRGYHHFRKIYADGDNSLMEKLACHGQNPDVMVIACCDSRVDPALILQCNPGDLFIVRNVANIVPPYEVDDTHHGTSAALEFGICYLNVKHLIIFGHSQCAGIDALVNNKNFHQNDFISQWVSLIETHPNCAHDNTELAKKALIDSYKNCLTFHWIEERLTKNILQIHLWHFDIKDAEISTYSFKNKQYQPLSV